MLNEERRDFVVPFTDSVEHFYDGFVHNKMLKAEPLLAKFVKMAFFKVIHVPM